MVSVIADNQAVERTLNRLVALCEAGGAEFSRDLVIKCVDGNLSVEAASDSVGKTLVRLPWDCLVPLSLFRIGIAGDKFVIESHEPEITSTCIETMDAMLELFNLTHKLSDHRRTSPWSLIASHPGLLAHLRPTGRFQRYNLMASGSRVEIELQSFFNARTLSYQETPDAPAFPVLMPILDAMNHHSEGASFSFDDRTELDRVLTTVRSNSVPGAGNECFAYYGVHDCFDSWIGYGFIDEAPGLVRSLAMDINLPDHGTIRIIDAFKPRTKEVLPSSVHDLQFYIPKLFSRGPNQLDIASVLIPGPRAPRALRRTLHFLLTELNPSRPPSRDLILNAEHQIIATNETHYRTLAAFLCTMPLNDVSQRPILDNFIRMCELQLRHLRNYTSYATG